MTRRLQLLAACALLLSGACSVSPNAVPLAPSSSAVAPQTATLGYGVYAWDAQDVFDRYGRNTLWPYLKSKHVDDVLLGFTDADISKYSTFKGTTQINAMIAQGHQHGVRFELLLGDPSWIPPSGVASLTGVIKKLRKVEFDGLNLDLEPNEVKNQAILTVLKELVTSMQAYIAASPWPVTLDLNWIYALPSSRTKNYCLTCHLQTDSGLKNVALMTYISTPSTVLKVDKPIVQKFPGISFVIAQSVEPPSVVPAQDSYWADGFATFYEDMQTVDSEFSPMKNYDGILIESLPYLEKMKP